VHGGDYSHPVVISKEEYHHIAMLSDLAPLYASSVLLLLTTSLYLVPVDTTVLPCQSSPRASMPSQPQIPSPSSTPPSTAPYPLISQHIPSTRPWPNRKASKSMGSMA
jgi:hypothetical protein